MLTVLIVAFLSQASPAKPVTPPKSEPAQSPAPSQMVSLPPAAAALIVKATIAAEMVRSCQTQLTAVRDRASAVTNRQTDLKNQEADWDRDLEKADVAYTRVSRTPTSDEAKAIRADQKALKTKLDNSEDERRNLASELDKLTKEMAKHTNCIDGAQKMLKSMLDSPSQ